jgi:hypothetical protein
MGQFGVSIFSRRAGCAQAAIGLEVAHTLPAGPLSAQSFKSERFIPESFHGEKSAPTNWMVGMR